MKKISAALLAILMLVSSIVLSSCKDPLEEKINELNAAYDALGQSYYNAIYACAFAGVYENEEYTKKFTEWKAFAQQAKKEKNAYLDYTEEEMDEIIAKWNGVKAELDALAEMYPLPTVGAASAGTVETEAE